MATNAEKLKSLNTRLDAYRAAELKILTLGQSYSVHDISKDRGRLEWIQKAIAAMESQISAIEANMSGDSQGHTVVFGRPTT